MPEMSAQQAIEMALRCQQAGQWEQAESIYRQILVGRPGSAEVWSNLGMVLRASGRLDEAIQSFNRAIRLRADLPEAHSNLGDALRARGELEPAIAACRQALALRPRYSYALNNLGFALKSAGRYDEAIAAFRQALDVQPDFAMARFNLGSLLLLKGDYGQGWPLYESRWQLREHQPLRLTFDAPCWDGADLAGWRILIHVEQGFGDCIQFARYLPLVKERGGTIILLCQRELVRLFRQMDCVQDVLTTGDTIPEFDLHCPLGSLPLIFGTTPATIPAAVPYLHPDPQLSAQWRQRLASGGIKKVGLVWAGSAVPDPNRSIPISDLAPLFEVSGVQFVSLQMDAPCPTTLMSVGQQIHDFADTAAIMGNLELIISIDTAALHLAGALARPTWALLPFVPDWRWLLDRSDSPWYPTMRLFRQQAIGDWQMPVRQIVQSLQSFIISSQ